MLIFWVTCGAISTVIAAVTNFESLLSEAQLVFQKPAGFDDLKPDSNEVMNYERAIKSRDNRLEIRIAIRPLQRMQIDYDDPHGAVPDPDHIFPLVFESLLSRLAAGRYSPSREYPAGKAVEYFNADWAAAAVFDTNPEFKTGFSQGMVLALHKNKVSDAYVVFLFDDYSAVKPLLEKTMVSLVYAQTDTKTP